MVPFNQPHSSIGAQACVLIIAGCQCIQCQSSHQNVFGESLKHQIYVCRRSREIPEQHVIDLVLVVMRGKTVNFRLSRVKTQSNAGEPRQ